MPLKQASMFIYENIMNETDKSMHHRATSRVMMCTVRFGKRSWNWKG